MTGITHFGGAPRAAGKLCLDQGFINNLKEALKQSLRDFSERAS